MNDTESINDTDDLAGFGQSAGDGLPTVYLPSSETTLWVLRRLQALVLKHPVAAKAAFDALIAEGRAFAQTPEGKGWLDKLAASELLHRARLVLDFPGLSMLERDSPEVLPSAYLDTIFMLASSRKPDELLDPLFEWGRGDDQR
jgi:hypothetical protein